MINNVEEETIKTILSELCVSTGNLTEKLEALATAMDEVKGQLRDLKKTDTHEIPVSVMKADDVAKAVKNNLTSSLVNSTLRVDSNVKASLDSYTVSRINAVIQSADRVSSEMEGLKPRRPLVGVNLAGKPFWWVCLSCLLVGMSVAIGTVIWACNTVASLEEAQKEQPSYWAERAYRGLVTLSRGDPARAYDYVMSHYHEDPMMIQKDVEKIEADVEAQLRIKRLVLEYADAEDVRILDWESDNGEWWILYRYYDEEKERSMHIWPSGLVEETFDKIVRNLEAARKYSKRRIWTELSRKQVEP